MSTFTSFAGNLQASGGSSTASAPNIESVDLTTAGTEYSYVLPANCRQFLIKLRSSALLHVTYTAGQSGTSYLLVPRNCFYAESDLNLPSTITLYFQSNENAQVAEILTWV